MHRRLQLRGCALQCRVYAGRVQFMSTDCQFRNRFAGESGRGARRVFHWTPIGLSKVGGASAARRAMVEVDPRLGLLSEGYHPGLRRRRRPSATSPF